MTISVLSTSMGHVLTLHLHMLRHWRNGPHCYTGSARKPVLVESKLPSGEALLASSCFKPGFFFCVLCRPHHQLHSRAVLGGLDMMTSGFLHALQHSLLVLCRERSRLPFILPVYSRLIAEQRMPHTETFEGK